MQQGSLLALSVLIWVCGCDRPSDSPQKIRLLASDGEQDAPRHGSRDALKLAIASVLSPERSVTEYWPLKIYLSSRLDRPVEFVFRKTYAETNELLRIGGAHVGIVCSGAYVRGKDRFGLKLLVAPFTQQGPVYHSYIIVRSDSKVDRFEQLRGKSFAFMDPLSNSGCLYPRYLLAKMGAKSEAFFSRHFFTHSHDNSVRAVADGLADGAAVDSLVYQQLVAEVPDLGDRLKVILKSPAFGISPVVSSPKTPPGLRDRIRTVLLAMNDDPKASSALAALSIEGFQPLGDHAYDSIREMLRTVEQDNGPTLDSAKP